MSAADLSRFVTQALDDAELRHRIAADPGSAFTGFDLTGEERQAIQTGDEGALQRLGIDAMTAHSFAAFHDVGAFAPDKPDASGDLPPREA